ncbi:O-antigen ligase family protein [Candidatus Oleimmundimicrobium sp.]|uniref:O-antigen ligase family protein n=1 Tax=Candidatus Oleimmundimicrobium sp. TaxID=3060597 RepID=UPI0027180B4D|nr:O-antigen ligase family protein [Candidatus Oleimmundimicrobium sp.]MDO8886200.1 tetratricopeptide repeat protein [Candidatus Oleimmundimicrobium sp.]
MVNIDVDKDIKSAQQNKQTFSMEDAQFYVLALFAFIAPLAQSNLVVNGYYFAKLSILNWTAIILVALFLIRLIGGKGILRRTYLDIPIALFAVLFIVSTLNSVHLPTSIFGRYNYGEGIIIFASYLVLFFAASNINWTPKRINFMGGSFISTAFIVSLLGVAEFFGYGKFSGGAMGSFGSRISSTLGNPVFLGAFLAIALPIVFAKYFESKSLRDFSLFAGILLLILIALAMSLSLAGWLAASVGILVLLSVLGKDYIKKKKNFIIIFFIILLGFCLVGNFVLSFRGESAIHRATTVLTGQGSMGTRIENWKSAVIITGKRPIFGWGPGTYRIAMNKYMTLGKIQLEARAVDADAHNILLNTAATLGLPALIVLLCIFGMFIWRGAKIVSESEPDAKPMRAALFAAAVGYMAFWQLNPTSVTTTPFWWLLAGVIMGQKHISERDLQFKFSFFLKVLLVFLVAAVSLGALSATARPFLADMYYRKGIISSMIQNNEVVADGLFQKATRYAPYEKTYYLMAGDNWSKRYDKTKNEEDFNKAIEWYEKTLKINDVEPEAYTHMSNAYISLKSEDGYRNAIKYLGKAVEITPYHAGVHEAKGDCHFELDEYEEALPEYQEAAKIEPNLAVYQFKIGRCYEKLNQKDEAIVAYEAAYILDKNFVDALNAIKKLNVEN